MLLLLLLMLLLLLSLSGSYRHGLLAVARPSRSDGCDFWWARRRVAAVECRRCCEAFWLTESEWLGDVDREIEPPSLASIEGRYSGMPDALAARSSSDTLAELFPDASRNPISLLRAALGRAPPFGGRGVLDGASRMFARLPGPLRFGGGTA